MCSETDQDMNQLMVARHVYPTFPINPRTVAKAQTGGEPNKGRDPRAPNPKVSTCVGCKHYRARDDWEHSREIGQCCYPYDEPKIPECEACQRRKPRLAAGHSYDPGKCRYALDVNAAAIRVRHSTGARRTVPHEPQIPHDAEPTAVAPATRDGRELGQDGEELIQEEDQLARDQIAARGTRELGRALGFRPAEGEEEPPETGGAASSSQPAAGEGEDAPRRGRGQDLAP